MELKYILHGIDSTANKPWDEIKDIQVQNIAYNSQECRRDYIFIAIDGETTDGHNYVKDAYKRGTRIFVINKDIPLPEDSIKIFVKNSRKALSRMSANFFEHPSKDLIIIGITGTKGKTTTGNYIKAMLQEAGVNTGIIGTNGISYNGKEKDTINTTPESYELQRILRTMLDNGIKNVVLEVSSGGLMMERVSDIDFDIAVFSNISHDHIGPKEHPSFEHYLTTKAKLFKLSRHGIINIDDRYGDYMIENAQCSIETFSMKDDADFQAINIKLSQSLEFLGSNFICKMSEDEHDFQLSMPGTFNIYNALASIAVCHYLGIDKKTMKTVLKNIQVDGRVEVLPILDYASVIVDFAHNGVSLQNILSTLKEYKPKRMVCLIGSIGNRAQIRRKELGDIAAKECDVAILTSDNPDYEDPMKIINEISKSFTDSKAMVIKEPDREKAIYKGIELLKEGDIFLIAGKGHERYNLIKGKKRYFSDHEVATEAANRLMGKYLKVAGK